MSFTLENSGYVKKQGIYISPDAQEVFMYSDGDQVENFLSENIRKSKDLSVGSEELQKYIHDWPTLYHLSPQRADLLRPFEDQLKRKKVLEIGSGCGAITRYLGELGCSTLSLEGSLRRARITYERCRDLENVTVVNDNFKNLKCDEKFDFVLLIGVLEYSNLFMSTEGNSSLATLIKSKEFLAAGGKLIIAIENRIGLKYWAGAPEDHVGETYYNIQNLYSNKGVETFGHYELTSLIREAGFKISEFMYPFPDYKFADVIITDAGFKNQDFNPVELLLEKFEYFQNAKYDGRFNSNLAAYSLFNNQLLPYFANSFLVTATASEIPSLQNENQILGYVHSTLRKKQYCKQTTFVFNSDTETIKISRRLLYESNGYDSPYLQHVLQDESYINGRILLGTILSIMSTKGWSTKDIINWAHTFYEVIVSKSFEKDNQVWLEGKYLDLTPFNISLANGKSHFFDLEWISKEDIPAYYVFFRGLAHSLWRILFVERPDPGTPLQVVQLAKEVTKYYFQFDDAEFNDCKEREIKYFSTVSTFEMTEPFPPLELNVRNSDYLKLLEANKELSLKNSELINELNNNQQQLHSKIVSLLEEAKQKEEQFNREKIALLDESIKKDDQLNSKIISLLEEAKQKEEQFTCERISFLNEARKGKEQFDSEKIALLQEAHKKETDLVNEISHQKNIVKWYVDTYEARSLLGVLKEKLKGKKKNLNKSIPGSSPQHRTNNDIYFLNAANDLATAGKDEFVVTGPDPFFTVQLNKKIKGGWYWLSIEIIEVKGKLRGPKLYYDCGKGYDEEGVWNLPKVNNNRIEALVLFPSEVQQLRFDPTTLESTFLLKNFYLQAVSKLSAFKSSVLKDKKSISPSFNQLICLADFMSTLVRSGRRGINEKIKNSIVLNDDNQAMYKNWCELYDTISEAQLVIIRSLANDLSYRPLFSIIMPVYNAPVNFLKKAIESVRNQAYDNWELCIADDRSIDDNVIKLLKEYSSKDDRIKIVFRETNGHISCASNSALEIALGDYAVLLDQDDELRPHALYMVAKSINDDQQLQLIYSDEDKIDSHGNRFDPYFKTDWNKDLFYGQNMISHLGVYKKSLLEKVGGFRKGYEGSQDYDLALRCLEYLQPEQIHHIPHILYHWRAITGSTAISVSNKNYAFDAGFKALSDHLKRTTQRAKTEKNLNNSYRVKWELPQVLPKVSIIIPTKNNAHVLSTCIRSLIHKTNYSNYEVLVMDNNSDEPSAIEYLKNISKEFNKLKIHRYTQTFNFSAIINYGVKLSTGEIVVLLNNDTEVINDDWLTEMVSQCLREDIGAVGAKLFYPNGQIQHAGVFLYDGHPGNHIYIGRTKDDPGYFNKLNLVQNYSAVTAACLAVRKDLFMEVGGLDEVNLKIAYNDVDFCLRLKELGYRNLWTPFAQLYHYESLSRGNDLDEANFTRFKREHTYMLSKWRHVVHRDPFFNPNLGHDTRTNQLAFPPRITYEWQLKKVKD